MMNEVKCLLLLAKVYKSHKKEDVMETLNQVTGQGLDFLRACGRGGARPQSTRATGPPPLLIRSTTLLISDGWAGQRGPEVREALSLRRVMRSEVL